MKREDAIYLRNMLRSRRTLALSVLLDGKPYASLAPFVVRDDFTAVIVHASDLARHTRGLHEGAPFSVMIHAPEEEAKSALEVPRISIFGSVRKIEDGSDEYKNEQRRYLERFPESEITFGLADFHLYALEIAKARMVLGFARTVNLTRVALASLAELPEDEG